MVSLLGLGGCGGGGGSPRDAPPDVVSACGSEAAFAGENIDWDSSDARFCGVAGATWTVRGDPGRTTATPPNGRVELCLARQAQTTTQTTIDIAPPAASSGCLGADGTPYPRRGVAIASEAVIAAGGAFSARSMTRAREAAMFALIGGGSASYDAARAQLVVHVDGAPHAVSLSVAHAAALQRTGDTWAAAPDPDAPVGSDVWFPNVAPGALQISVAGGATGPSSLSLEPDAFTYVAVIAH